MLTNSTSRESWKIAFVPLPWWTSQSRTSTRSAPSESSAWRAATATFANRQKPSALRPLGVVPGRPKRGEAGVLATAEQRLGQRTGAARRPQGRLIAAGAGGRVHVERLAAGAHVAHPRHVLGRVHAQQLLLARRGRLARLPAEPVTALELAPRSRGSGRPARDAHGRCRAPARPGGGRTAASAPVRYLRAVNEPLRTDVAVVGAGAAGLYAALVAADQGASVALVSRSPLAQTASYWAQGGIAAALSPDDSPAQHADDTLAAGREAARESAVRVLCEESPDRVRHLQELGVQFDADRGGNLALGLEGGHSQRRIVHAGGAATGRRITRALSALAATHERVQVLEPVAATAIATDEGRASGLALRSRDGAPLTRLGAGGDPRHRRHGGALAAHHEPARRRRIRAQPREHGRRGAGRPRVHAVPPDGAAARRAARRLPRNRGGARRGRAPLRPPGRALRGRAGAARRGGARHPHGARADRRAGRLARHASRGRGALPQHRGRARRGRPRPEARPAPRGARRALHDGWNRHRPRGALVAGRPVRGGRVRVHRPARREPAGLELARRMPRVRAPRCACRDRRAGLGGSGGAGGARGARRSPARTRAPRSGATPGCAATPPDSPSCSRTPTRSRG